MSRPVVGNLGLVLSTWSRRAGLIQSLSTHKKSCTSLWQQTRSMKLYRERTIRAMYWRARSFDAIKFPDRRRDERIDWNYRAEIYAFSRRLQENLSEDTLRRCFAHPSYLDKLKRSQIESGLPDVNIMSNEEFVQRGEQLLDDCIKPYLRHALSRLPEEGIAAITSYLKSEAVMADIASWIGCREIVLTAEWPPSETTLANTVRAVIGGIDKDLGLDRVRRFIVDIVISYLEDKDLLDDVWQVPNPKETLALILENSRLPPYEPRLMFQTGVKTIEPCFLVGLYVNKKFLGSSAGETVAIAEECAALDSLQRIFDLRDNREPFIYGEASEKINYKANEKPHDSLKTWRFNFN